MYCWKCGESLNENEKKCPFCEADQYPEKSWMEKTGITVRKVAGKTGKAVIRFVVTAAENAVADMLTGACYVFAERTMEAVSRNRNKRRAANRRKSRR